MSPLIAFCTAVHQEKDVFQPEVANSKFKNQAKVQELSSFLLSLFSISSSVCASVESCVDSVSEMHRTFLADSCFPPSILNDEFFFS